jgi:hypothetical protein
MYMVFSREGWASGREKLNAQGLDSKFDMRSNFEVIESQESSKSLFEM